MLKRVWWYVKPFQYNMREHDGWTGRRTELLYQYSGIFERIFLEIPCLSLPHLMSFQFKLSSSNSFRDICIWPAPCWVAQKWTRPHGQRPLWLRASRCCHGGTTGRTRWKHNVPALGYVQHNLITCEGVTIKHYCGILLDYFALLWAGEVS